MPGQFRPRSFPYHLLVVFVLLALGIGFSGYIYHENQKRDVRKEYQDDLLAITELKVNAILRWRKERIADAQVILENPLLGDEVQNWLSNPSEPELFNAMLGWLTSLQTHYDYASAHIIGLDGVALLSVPDENPEINFDVLTRISDPVHMNKPFLSDLYRSDVDETISISLTVPLINHQEKDTRPIAYLFLVIDPHSFLFPLVQSWPTPSPTSESLLVRRDGNEVLFLNELRHRKNTALTMRLPMNSPGSPAAMAVRGQEGVVEGVDYRGVTVYAAMEPIPGSTWFLIAKIDEEEVLAPIHENGWLIGLLVGVMIAGAAVTVGFIWSQQSAHFFRKQYESEMRRLEIVQRYEFLTKYANDIILLLDEDGNVIEANERGVASYGYTPDELVHLNIRDLRAEETLPLLEEQLLRAKRDRGILFETVHRRKDGTTFPVEVSSRMIKIADAHYHQSIIRDITERKQAEEALREAHEQLEMRVLERTAELLKTNVELRNEISERMRVEEALRESERQVRLRSSQLLMAQETERKRVACELHDGIGQTLTAVKMAVDDANRRAVKGLLTSETLQSLAGMVQHTIDEARRIYMNLRPSILDDLGILATINWFCQEMSKIHAGMHIVRQIAIEEGDVPETLKIVIFRIIQEAFHNITKYSKAREARFSLAKSDGKITLIISDDGEGFDVDDALSRATQNGCLGLNSMKERAELAGGKLTIHSTISHGTTIQASWPCARGGQDPVDQ